MEKLMQPTEDDMVKVCECLDSIKKTELSREKACKRIPLSRINSMFKNFGYYGSTVNGYGWVHSKKFDPGAFGMDLDGDVITASSKNPFKRKYRYELVVDVKNKYFVIVRKVHIYRGFCANVYCAKTSHELSKMKEGK